MGGGAIAPPPALPPWLRYWLSTPPMSPLLAPEALWRVLAQAIPLELNAVRTSQGTQPGFMVRSCGLYKTL